MTIVHAAIGNSDHRLTQVEWSMYCREFFRLVREHAAEIHGEWYSGPGAPHQNACAGFSIDGHRALLLRDEMSRLAGEFRQESIAWAACDRTEFLEGS
jgi:hypothetical protein